MSVLPLPLPPPQVAKPEISPEAPSTPSVKNEMPPDPSKVKLPLAVEGANPAIKLGDSTGQLGVKVLGSFWFEVVIETTGETTLAAGVPPTVMAL